MSNKKFSILTATVALLVFYFISQYKSPYPSMARHQPNLLLKGEEVVEPSPVRRGQGEVSFVSSSPTFIVTRIVDGDTIQIDTGQKVRYIGMNTPETVDPRRPVQCFGHEASDYNKKLVENKKVKLVKDVSEKDKYGRLLRYVYLADGTFVNLKLVQDGYAYADTFPPDVAHAADFVKAQRQARNEKLGLWGKCK